MNDDIGIQLGERLKLLREAEGLTQAQLAGILGKSVETISNFERGRTIPSVRTLDFLSKKLEVPISDFFDDQPPKKDLAGLSKNESKLKSLLPLLAEDDLELLVSVSGVLETRRRKANSSKD